ncbi:MAG: ATP-binding protein [Myxococcales bacterium]|nr:hybrid sensor histidine kinase/response regulator [Myxococcales bacterium]
MKRLLLVEDNQGDVELLRLRMSDGRSPPPRIAVAETLAEGIATYAREGADAVLLDMALPDSTGLETVETFRKAAPAAPVIVLTGLNDLDIAVAALRVGADDYLVKGELTPELLRRSVFYALERRRLSERARRAIDSRDEILRIVSHDMRNHMATVIAGLHLIKTDVAEDKRTRRLAQIEKAAMTIRRLIGDLIDVDALDKGTLHVERAPCDAASLIEAAQASFAPVAERRKLRLEAGAQCRGVDVLCDRERILQVLGNLLNNAIKFTPEGGSIELSCASDDGKVRFSVRDTGPGIPEEQIDRVFERFFRGSQQSQEGLGLGLTVARALVEAHGGVIGVSSKPGEGALFWFTLPVAR